MERVEILPSVLACDLETAFPKQAHFTVGAESFAPTRGLGGEVSFTLLRIGSIPLAQYALTTAALGDSASRTLIVRSIHVKDFAARAIDWRGETIGTLHLWRDGVHRFEPIPPHTEPPRLGVHVEALRERAEPVWSALDPYVGDFVLTIEGFGYVEAPDIPHTVRISGADAVFVNWARRVFEAYARLDVHQKPAPVGGRPAREDYAMLAQLKTLDRERYEALKKRLVDSHAFRLMSKGVSQPEAYRRAYEAVRKGEQAHARRLKEKRAERERVLNIPDF